MPEMNRQQRKAAARIKAKTAQAAPPPFDPSFVQAINDGLQLHQQGRIDDAIAAFRKAIAVNPNHPLAYGNLGAILNDRGQSEESVALCQKAVALDPSLSLAHNNLGLALTKLKRPEEAIAAFSRAVAAEPANTGAMNNMTTPLLELGRLAEAEAATRKAIALNPGHAKSYSNLGTVLEAAGRMEEAAAAYRQAVALAPDLAPAHKYLGMILLMLGQFAEGWREYDWRWAADKLVQPNHAKPVWRGELISGQTLLLYSEQGLGDVIQFARFATLLAAQGVRVIFQAHQQQLTQLMRSLHGVAAVISTQQQPPPFDYYQALMSVPGVMGVTPETIPAPIPYLAAEPERVALWRERLGTHGFKVGIVWQGKCNTASESARSASLACFAPLANIEGVRLISLQKQIAGAQPDPLTAQLRIETCGPDFDQGPHAFLDTAAVMENLDLVITIDTSVAHLAGALGRPVWIALKHVPDWRWTMAGAQSPWYPTARLFRQRHRDDWSPVFAEIAEALRAAAQTAPRPA